MTTHPMLAMREPPPEIDVSKKALPKRLTFSQRYGYTDAHGNPTPKGLATISAAQALEPPMIGGTEGQPALPVAADPEREAPADGWIEWKGGECPVPHDAVAVKTRDGREETLRVGRLWQWDHKQDDRNYGDIIAYRVLA